MMSKQNQNLFPPPGGGGTRPIFRVILLIFLCVGVPAYCQSDDFERDLATFDNRADDVRELVESSRNPDADAIFNNATRTRDQAEAAYRQGNLAVARNLLDRALALLVQAENLARGGTSSGGVRAITNRLKAIRQNLQDSRRWLHDLETDGRNTDGPSLNRSFLNEQLVRTGALLNRAENECANSDSARCQDLLRRARMLFEQASSLVPDSLEPVARDERAVENRLRDAREFLDRAQSELDQIQREISNPEMITPGALTRLRNIENLIRLGNDRLQEADFQPAGLQQGQTTTALSNLRRASELAHLAMRSVEDGVLGQSLFAERSERVESIRIQVANLEGVDGVNSAEYNQGVSFQDQARSQADSGNYEAGLLLLSQAATAFNNALVRRNADAAVVSPNNLYNDLKAEFEKEYSATVSSVPPNDTTRPTCAEQLTMARNQADQSEELRDSGNLQLALNLINQAQQSLNEAKACLGQNTSRVANVLNRLQIQFDKRLPALEESVDSSDSAAQVFLSEAKALRDLSDSQEVSGQYEMAVQTAGRALESLGSLQRVATNATDSDDLDLVQSLQGKFDERVDKVREWVEESGSDVSVDLLDRAVERRNRSENTATGGNPRLALTEIGQAISLLERAALGR